MIIQNVEFHGESWHQKAEGGHRGCSAQVPWNALFLTELGFRTLFPLKNLWQGPYSPPCQGRMDLGVAGARPGPRLGAVILPHRVGHPVHLRSPAFPERLIEFLLKLLERLFITLP